MYTLIFDKEAIHFLSKLPSTLKQRIFTKLVLTKENPFRYFKRLGGRKDFSLRIGDYRVIADIAPSTKVINITLIGHRKNVYTH